MFKKIILISFFFFLSSFSFASGKISVKVKLSPAGSFNMDFKDVKGKIKKSGDSVSAKKISAKVKTLKTGMDLRDKHSKEKLKYKEHPYIKVTDIKGKKGVGVGTILIRGIKKKIKFNVFYIWILNHLIPNIFVFFLSTIRHFLFKILFF